MKTIKVGFDVHGVLDTHEAFVRLAQVLYNLPGFEVHIITGNSKSKGMIEKLEELNVKYDYFFSITDFLEAKGMITWKDGYPWTEDNSAWNSAKSIYCRDAGIDIMLDDSNSYGKFFEEIGTVYCKVNN